jgi:hypothetical protein
MLKRLERPDKLIGIQLIGKVERYLRMRLSRPSEALGNRVCADEHPGPKPRAERRNAHALTLLDRLKREGLAKDLGPEMIGALLNPQISSRCGVSRCGVNAFAESKYPSEPGGAARAWNCISQDHHE